MYSNHYWAWDTAHRMYLRNYDSTAVVYDTERLLRCLGVSIYKRFHLLAKQSVVTLDQ